MSNKLLKLAANLFLSVEECENPFIVKARLATCRRCDNLDAEKDQCKICGCFVEVKAAKMTNRNPNKMGRVEITHCPMGYWGDKPIANLYRKQDGEPRL